MGLKWFRRSNPVERLKPAELTLSIEDKYDAMLDAVKDYRGYFTEVKNTGITPTQDIKDRKSVQQFKCASHLVDPVDGFKKMTMTKEQWSIFCTSRRNGLNDEDKESLKQKINQIKGTEKMFEYIQSMDELDRYLKSQPTHKIG